MVLQQLKQARSLFLHIMLFAVLAFATLSASASQPGTDELMFLTGVIKSIDYNYRRVVVDVVNKGCNGVKTFSIDDPLLLRAVMGDQISFYSDSAYCPKATGHKMFPQGKRRTR